MNRTTTNRAPPTPNWNLKDNDHYFTPTRAKFRGAVEFRDRIGIDYFKEDNFRAFNVSSREGWDSSMIAILLADYIMILMLRPLR